MNNSISCYGHYAFGRHEGNVPSITNFGIEYLLLLVGDVVERLGASMPFPTRTVIQTNTHG